MIHITKSTEASVVEYGFYKKGNMLYSKTNWPLCNSYLLNNSKLYNTWDLLILM